MKTYPFAQIYRWPAIVGAILFSGLLFALFGDGVWDAISWVLLGLPLLLLTYFLLRGRARGQAH